MKVKPVKTIQIAGHTVKIIYQKKMKGEWGRCYIDDKEIHLNAKCLDDKELHDSTLFHEIAHYCLGVSGISWIIYKKGLDIEEGVVRCLDNLFIPAILTIIKK